ncbi:MAG: hypothetical protein KQH57_19125 [Actinomycetales bacterium]|nr:hypothetical protein [Actinomycetales bacterium]
MAPILTGVASAGLIAVAVWLWRLSHAPLRVSIDRVTSLSDGDLLIINGEPADSPQPPIRHASDDSIRWRERVRKHGDEFLAWTATNGVALEHQTVRLTLRARDSRPLHVKRMRVVLLREGEPLSGWFVYLERGGGVEIRSFAIDLDELEPCVYLEESGEGYDIRPGEKTWVYLRRDFPPFTVSESDTEVFDVTCYTAKGYFEWGIDIDYNDGRRARDRTMRLRNQRLRVTAKSPDRQFLVLTSGKGLVRDLPQSKSEHFRKWCEPQNRLALLKRI